MLRVDFFRSPNDVSKLGPGMKPFFSISVLKDTICRNGFENVLKSHKKLSKELSTGLFVDYDSFFVSSAGMNVSYIDQSELSAMVYSLDVVGVFVRGKDAFDLLMRGM